MFFKLLWILLFVSLIVKGQESAVTKELIADLAEDLPEDFDLSEITERLLFFKKHPVNLNTVDEEMLKDLYFLSPLQIVNLLNYRQKNGKLIDVLELQAIDGFDRLTIQKMLPYVSINEAELQEKLSFSKLFSQSENDLVIRVSRTLERQKGFKDHSYLGSPEKFMLRYKFNFSNRISASYVMEKDAGEKFIARPFDFIAGNITIAGQRNFKKIIIGDYSLQFGEGLTLWSGFGYGKGAGITGLAKKDIGLKPYSSANEYAFFRGIASTIELTSNLQLSAFISFRKLDAANENEELVSINETGYHRTLNEINNASSLRQRVYGAVFKYHENNLNMGLIGYNVKHNLAFINGPSVYQSFNYAGKNLCNLGFHYNYTYKNMYLFGEAAKSISGGIALINGLLVNLSSKISAVILHRNYPKDYHNFFNQAVAEAEGFNERGFYTGLNFGISPKWFIAAYTDFFKFPWLKFRVDAPSGGHEIFGQATFTPKKGISVNLRYKSEIKQQNTELEVPVNYLEEVKKESYRIDLNWKFTSGLMLQHKIEVSQYRKGSTQPEFGFLIAQDFAYAPVSTRLSGNFRLAYFYSPSYNSRLYAYEDDVLYNFSFGIYSGKGFRSYVNFKYRFGKNLDLWLRYASYYYYNTTTIGTGQAEISGHAKSEAKVQLRYQF